MTAPLPAYVQITNLVNRYAELVDAQDIDGLVELFADGEIHRRDGVVRGEQIRSNFGRLPFTLDERTRVRHVTTNLILEVDEDAGVASARCVATVLKCTAAERIEPIFSNRYHDEFACTDGVWHFTVRRYVDPMSTAVTAGLVADQSA